jgi:hypothetical protein
MWTSWWNKKFGGGGGENESTLRKLYPVSLSQPQNTPTLQSHRAAAVGGRRLTALAIAWPDNRNVRPSLSKIQWKPVHPVTWNSSRNMWEYLCCHCFLYIHQIVAGVTVTYLRSYVTGNNDAILNEIGWTTAVSLVGGGASWTRRCVGTSPRGPAGQRQSRGLDQYD